MEELSKEKREEIGYLKYVGKSVEDGFMDARKSAEALLGFDEILRYFLSKEKTILGRKDLEIPVRVKKGSLLMVLGGAGVLIGTTYLNHTAKQAAEKGILNTSMARDLNACFKSSIKMACWVGKIGLHIGTLTKKSFEKVKIDIKSGRVLILNEEGKVLAVPKKYFDIYVECPSKIFSKSASLIEKEKSLEFGLYKNGKEDGIRITEKEKGIFYQKNEESDEFLFPELRHNQYVELEGEITRVTESTNSLGFRYREHVLICNPQKGTVAQFKEVAISEKDNHFFPKVKVFGVVSRMKEDGELNRRKPRIKVSKIESLEIIETFNQRLF